MSARFTIVGTHVNDIEDPWVSARAAQHECIICSRARRRHQRLRAALFDRGMTDSPETSAGHTAPLPPPDVPRCDGCRWWEAHAFDGECSAVASRPRSARTTGPLFTLPHHRCAMWTPKEMP